MTKDEKNALLERIAVLETRVQELERCKHDSHTIGDDALQQITTVVKSNIASSLQPAQPVQEQA